MGVSAIGAGNMTSPSVAQAKAISPAPNKAPNGVRYNFDNPTNQWRMLRVANATHNVSFIEWDPKFVFRNVSFSALFDLTEDPHQLKNLWSTTSAAQQATWHSELEKEFQCTGRTGDKACS